MLRIMNGEYGEYGEYAEYAEYGECAEYGTKYGIPKKLRSSPLNQRVALCSSEQCRLNALVN
jgi:hypothetical protein